jgi:hypothetical protein
MHVLIFLFVAIAPFARAEKPPVAFPEVAAPLEALEIVATPRAEASEKLGAQRVIHVFLQRHGHRRDGARVETEASRTCAERLVATANVLVGEGVTAAVVEGLNLVGGYSSPEPVTVRSGDSAAEQLTNIDGLTVYGFESKAIQPRSISQMNIMREAANDLTYLKNNKSKFGDSDDQLARLHEIQERLFPANTEFVIAGTPLRSFQALQAAFAVADSRNENSVILLIGSSHWPDFVHTVKHADRLGNDMHVGVQMIRYDCDAE